MVPSNNDNKIKINSKPSEDSSSELEGLLNRLRKTEITAILAMNKKAQITVLNWANNLVNQYDAILKNNPMKLKDIAGLPCSKMDAKLAIKLLMLTAVEKKIEDNTVVNLKDKFVSLGSFQSIDQKDKVKLIQYISDIQKQSMDAGTPSFPELNKYMSLIISEQKALLDEINSFIRDIRRIKKHI